MPEGRDRESRRFQQIAVATSGGQEPVPYGLTADGRVYRWRADQELWLPLEMLTPAAEDSLTGFRMMTADESGWNRRYSEPLCSTPKSCQYARENWQNPNRLNRSSFVQQELAVPLPAEVELALAQGELTERRLRELITLKAQALGLSFGEAVRRARERRLPHVAAASDLEFLVQLLPA